MPSTQGTTTASPAACLNCGAGLYGRFCSQCGQRAMPPYPAMQDLLADSWHEATGWDGRYARTLRALFRRPGALTADVLDGHWARYVPPLRLYLLASVLYFLVGAAVPNLLAPKPAAAVPGSRITINFADPDSFGDLSPEQRAEVLARIDRAPAWVQPFLRSALTNPGALRDRVRQNMPRVAFALVPVFAVLLALVYRRRPFSQHLIFALHFHTALFLVWMSARAVHVAGSRTLAAMAGLVAFIYVGYYGLSASRRLYRPGVVALLFKSAAIVVLYLLVASMVMVGSVVWAALW